MKIDKKHFILSRARNIGKVLAEEEFKLLQERAKARVSTVKIYLDEYGNEVHVKGPIVDRVRKVETLQERIQRYDRLAAAVRASRASMMHAMGEMFTDDPDEDPEDDSLLDDTPSRDEFGDLTPNFKRQEIGAQDGEEPAAPTSQAGVQPTAEPVSEPEPVPAE